MRSDLIKILSESNPLVADLSEELQFQVKESSQNQNGSLVLVWEDPSAIDGEKKVANKLHSMAWQG